MARGALPFLPPELWEAIVHHLRLPPIRLGDTEPDDSYHPNQAALRNLCLTSHKLKSIAQPVLYHTIVLHDSQSPSLYLLVRTLAKRAELSRSVRNLAVTPDSELLEETIWLEIIQRYPEPSFEAPPNELGFFNTSGLSLTGLSEDIFERLLGSLLCLTPNLQRLLIELRPGRDLSVVGEVLQHQIISRALAGSHDVLPLPNLATLQVQAHPKTNGNGRYLESVNMRACPILLDLPTIRTLDVYQVDGADWVIDNTYGNWLAKVHKMRLYTGMHMRKLRRVLMSASNLKSLELMVDCYEEESYDIPGDINQAIATRADTLEDLFVSTQGLAGYTAILGNEIRLDCLSNMRKLRILHIETNLLFHKKSRMNELDLHTILPPDLRELRLDECWYISDEDSDDIEPEDYIRLLLSQFETLAAFRDEKLPKLEKVRFWSWEWGMEDMPSWGSKALATNFIRKSRKVLRKANIKFMGPDIDSQPEILVVHSCNEEYVMDVVHSDESDGED